MRGLLRKRSLRLWLVPLALVTTLLVIGGVALAVHDADLFELDVVNGVGDGNTIDEAKPSPEGTTGRTCFRRDVECVRLDVHPGSLRQRRDRRLGRRGPRRTASSPAGGSKDTLCLQDPCEDGSGGPGGPWLYDTVNDVVPDKNDIVNAFAAAYEDPDDGTRSSTSGSTRTPSRAPTTSASGSSVSRSRSSRSTGAPRRLRRRPQRRRHLRRRRVHQGGGVGTIQVYRWDNTPGPGGKPIGPVLSRRAPTAPRPVRRRRVRRDQRDQQGRRSGLPVPRQGRQHRVRPGGLRRVRARHQRAARTRTSAASARSWPRRGRRSR